MVDNIVSVVIGSWGSYVECNERSLGSKWLRLNDFKSWEEIEQKLKNEGFELEGIDEELFIQDIEGLPIEDVDWDNMHPKFLFETLLAANVLFGDSAKYNFNTMLAYVEVESWSEFEELVKNKGTQWWDDIRLYNDMDWEEYGEDLWESFGYNANIPEHLKNYIDYEAFGKDQQYNGYAHKTSYGILEIY